MVVLETFASSSWMDWVNWRLLWLERRVSESVTVDEAMVLVELWIVQSSNPFRLVFIHLVIIIHLNWTISLLYNPLKSELGVSFGLHHSRWLVWLIDWIEFTDLPQLQSVKLDNAAFCRVYSVVFESDWMDGLMIQICLNYNPFNLDTSLLMATIVLIEKRLTSIPITTRTHW